MQRSSKQPLPSTKRRRRALLCVCLAAAALVAAGAALNGGLTAAYNKIAHRATAHGGGGDGGGSAHARTLADFVVRPVPSRMDIAALLQEEGFKTAIELGVQEGVYARHNLEHWPACTRYHLVDLWAKQLNYTDWANVDQEKQDEFLENARRAVAPWKDKVTEHRMLTVEAAPAFADGSIDFIYVDARHDYCGVMEDLVTYWPKLRPGGIMAGHDYLDAAQVRAMTPGQDWSICHDGRVVEGAVRQAVDEWAASHDLVVTVTYHNEAWPTWLVRKPR